MLPGTIEERRQLALDIMDQVNFFPKALEKKHAYVLGLLLNTITDPRIQTPVQLPLRTRIIHAIKKNTDLWARVSMFAIPFRSASDICKCQHHALSHVPKIGSCTGRVYRKGSSICKCKYFVGKGL